MIRRLATASLAAAFLLSACGSGARSPGAATVYEKAYTSCTSTSRVQLEAEFGSDDPAVVAEDVAAEFPERFRDAAYAGCFDALSGDPMNP